MRKSILLTLAVILSLGSNANAKNEKELYRDLNLVSDIYAIRYNMEERFYKALYFDDVVDFNNYRSAIESLSTRLNQYSNAVVGQKYFQYCSYVGEEVLKEWQLRNELLKTEITKDSMRGLIKQKSVADKYTMYCLNNIIGSM